MGLQTITCYDETFCNATRWISRLGVCLCLSAMAAIVLNQYSALSALNPYYRVNTPALCLLFGFITAAISARVAIMGSIFALPLLPTFAWQFQLYTGYGRIQDVHGAGLDLVAGVVLGFLFNNAFRKQKNTTTHPLAEFNLPWPAGLAFIFISLSVAVAIMRNLYQSSASFSLQALVFNLMHLRTLTWHDDYRPLMDWIAYGGAFSLLAVFAPALRRMPDRNDIIFKPLIIGILIAALVGWRQSAFGAGLSHSLLNFRVDRFGFAALGFQPDLHAFAGHMLLGAIGLVGYAYYKRSNWVWLAFIGLVMPLSWWLLFLSKSKASLALGVLCSISIAMLWLLRKRVEPTRVLLGLITLCVAVLISAAVAPALWYESLSQLAAQHGLPDLLSLNLKLSYRPEVYRAALYMLLLFPFAGLGQAEFYRQAANPELSRSFFLSVEQNGENAHNYFLQILVENGLLGFSVLVFFVAYPILKSNNKKNLIPALFALLAIACGNLFSHSLLVRENLLIAASFIALLYAWAPQILSPNGVVHQLNSRTLIFLKNKYIVVVLVCISIGLVLYETIQSRRMFPFNTDVQCFKSRPLDRDNWTSGHYRTDVPVGATGFTIQLATTQPDAEQRPISGSLRILLDDRELAQKDFVLNKTGPQQLSFDLPAGSVATPDDYHVELRLSRCFVPRNFGMNEDSRRLGVRIEAIHWH